MRLIIDGGDPPRKPDDAMIRVFARARGWFEELASGRFRSLVKIARCAGLPKRYVTRLTTLAFDRHRYVIADGKLAVQDELADADGRSRRSSP